MTWTWQVFSADKERPTLQGIGPNRPTADQLLHKAEQVNGTSVVLQDKGSRIEYWWHKLGENNWRAETKSPYDASALVKRAVNTS